MRRATTAPMPAFYLTLLAVLFAGIGARDQMTVAALTLRQGRRPTVLLMTALCALATAALAAWGGSMMLKVLPPPARAIFAAIALGMAGMESLLIAPKRSPREPTNSLGALVVVTLAAQVTDAARFLVFGLAVGMAAPLAAGLAGALGGVLLVTIAWFQPGPVSAPGARWLRRFVGVLMTLVAIYIFLQNRGIL